MNGQEFTSIFGHTLTPNLTGDPAHAGGDGGGDAADRPRVQPAGGGAGQSLSIRNQAKPCQILEF